MTLKIWSIQLCITVGNVTEVLGFLPSLYGSLNERISTVNPHMRKRIALCHGTQQDNFHGIAKLVKIRLLVTHLPYSILKSAVTVYLDMAFSPLKNFASTVFFFAFQDEHFSVSGRYFLRKAKVLFFIYLQIRRTIYKPFVLYQYSL